MAGELDSLKTWTPRQRLLRFLALFGVLAVQSTASTPNSARKSATAGPMPSSS